MDRRHVAAAVMSVAVATGCATDPVDQLASEACEVLETYAQQDEDGLQDMTVEELQAAGYEDEDLISIFDVGDELERIQLEAVAGGVDMRQVEARTELDCPDAVELLERESRQIADLVDRIRDLVEESG